MAEKSEDKDLIESYFEGDERSLEILIERYIDQIYNFITRYTGGDQSEASDLTQETFVKAWKNLSKFDLDKSFKTWLFTIARNSSLDRIRKKKALPFSSIEEEDGDILNEFKSEELLADDLFDQARDRESLAKAVEALPEIYQTVITLRYEENFTFQEISEILKEPIDTIKSRYRRALLRLRKELAGTQSHLHQ